MRTNTKSPPVEAIVEPTLRPVDPASMPPKRQRLGIVFLTLGFVVVVVGGFVAFGELLFVVGSMLILVGLFLLGRFWRFSEKPHDGRKLYGIREV